LLGRFVRGVSFDDPLAIVVDQKVFGAVEVVLQGWRKMVPHGERLADRPAGAIAQGSAWSIRPGRAGPGICRAGSNKGSRRKKNKR